MKTTFKMEGLRELEKSLAELKPATGRNVARRVMLRAAEPIAQDAQSGAPVLKGRLQASAGFGTRLSRRQRKLNRKESPVEVYVGFGPWPQAHLQEFGTVDNPAQPFLRPAWDRGWRRALDEIIAGLWEEIAKAAARAARRSARLLKKGR